ncbi:MAG: iron-containing alcohol dehydrogenase [Lachnospiraceae bacterium]|nr:iron-containing alcohol dehydrogenase [Lachnospiraceae bacterium]
MQFYMPVRVYDEPDCVSRRARELSALGTKALIVTGKHSAARCGALGDVTSALRGCGVSYCHFSDVEENPSVETVVRAAEQGLKEKADFVIGIGGGSPMDAAKAAAFLMKCDRPAPEYLYDSAAASGHLPVAAVPTTCGTGSEVTGVSVLTRHDKKTKGSIPHRIFPAIALIDGKYLEAAGEALLINTSVDALAHLIESYLGAKADDYSRFTALSGLQIWKSVRGVLTGEKEAGPEERSLLMRASAFAGMSIAQTGTSLPHALSYIVTYDMKLPHGAAVGIFLAGFLREASPEDRGQILKAAGFADIDAFDEFLRKVLPEVLVPADTLKRTFESVSASPAKMNSCRFPADGDVLYRILKSASSRLA